MRTPIRLFMTVALLSCPLANADPPYARVSFQGKLFNTNGISAPDGGYDMVFKFYNASSNATLLLTDRHTANNSVLVSGGLYSVLLGGGEIVTGAESNLWSVFLKHS